MSGPAGVLSLYRDAPLPVRAHVRVRWATCPFRAVAAELPESGSVLEVGCGHGLLSLHLALASADRKVTGIDVDRDKLDAATGAADRAGLAATFEAVEGADLPTGPWDGIGIVDVLYLLSAGDQRSLLRACAERLAPGGVVHVATDSPPYAAQARRVLGADPRLELLADAPARPRTRFEQQALDAGRTVHDVAARRVG